MRGIGPISSFSSTWRKRSQWVPLWILTTRLLLSWTR